MRHVFRKIFLWASVLFILTSPSYSLGQSSDVKTLILSKESLQYFRLAYKNREKKSHAMIFNFLSDANKLLKEKAHSVTEKTITPPSGDKHDFMSMGPYWWPDSTKKDGLPYIRKDGQRNPEYYQIPDQDYFSSTVNNAETLAIAFYITNDSLYALKAVELIQVWFINADTKMNPNMQHAQYIPGINTGRGIGLIETREIFKVLDAVQLLRGSKYWSEENDIKFTKWTEDYFTWLTTHPYGIDESKEKNNHGTWYDVQLSSVALFLGKTDFAMQLFEDVKEKRIGTEIEPTGEQPLELARTKSWSYSCMNLDAFLHLALLAENVNIDLWNYTSERGGSIRKALDYLLPSAAGKETWKHQQISGFHKDGILQPLVIASKKFDGKIYAKWFLGIFPGKSPIKLMDMIY